MSGRSASSSPDAASATGATVGSICAGDVCGGDVDVRGGGAGGADGSCDLEDPVSIICPPESLSLALSLALWLSLPLLSTSPCIAAGGWGNCGRTDGVLVHVVTVEASVLAVGLWCTRCPRTPAAAARRRVCCGVGSAAGCGCGCGCGCGGGRGGEVGWLGPAPSSAVASEDELGEGEGEGAEAADSGVGERAIRRERAPPVVATRTELTARLADDCGCSFGCACGAAEVVAECDVPFRAATAPRRGGEVTWDAAGTVAAMGAAAVAVAGGCDGGGAEAPSSAASSSKKGIASEMAVWARAVARGVGPPAPAAAACARVAVPAVAEPGATGARLEIARGERTLGACPAEGWRRGVPLAGGLVGTCDVACGAACGATCGAAVCASAGGGTGGVGAAVIWRSA